MAVNDMTIEQGSKILNAIVSQASGAPLASIDTMNFITVAQLGLKSGYEKMTDALSQVLSRTIFSTRPYYRKFSGLMVDNLRYGNHVRKVNYIDNEFEDDARQGIADGSTVDQQKVKKPKVVQTNFYGEVVYSDSITIFKDQWDVALSSPEEFSRFVGGIFQNIQDRIEQAHESTNRFVIANLMDGTAKKVKLIESYNAAKGTTLTPADILKKENFTDFFQFAYASIMTYSGLLTERTEEYHTKLTGKPIMRHTPKANQKLYGLSYYNNLVETTVLSSVFNPEYLKGVDFENVNFWQSLATPEKIQGKFTSLTANGTLKQSAGTSPSAPIFAVLFDEEAAGVTTVNQWSAPSPFNAKGGYTNFNWHFTDRYWNDFTENSIVFTLE